MISVLSFCLFLILIGRDIEVVITGLTRNQFVRKHTRVRIPLSPPRKTSVELFQLRFFFIHCESNGISSRFSVYIIAIGAYHQPQVVSLSQWWYTTLRVDDIPQQVAYDIHALGVIKVRMTNTLRSIYVSLSLRHKTKGILKRGCFLFYADKIKGIRTLWYCRLVSRRSHAMVLFNFFEFFFIIIWFCNTFVTQHML